MDAVVAKLVHVATTNQTRLTSYLAAEERILSGQVVRFGERQLTLADLSEVRTEIARLQVAVARETANAAGNGGRFSQADFSQ